MTPSEENLYIEEYAKKIAIEFAEWLVDNGKPVSRNDKLIGWRLGSYQMQVEYTTKELYEKFLMGKDEELERKLNSHY